MTWLPLEKYGEIGTKNVVFCNGYNGFYTLFWILQRISSNMQPTMVHCKAFDIKTWQCPPSPSRGYPLFNTWDVMMNSVVLSPRNFHQYSVLSCRKHLYDYIISLVWVDKPSFDWSACTKPGGWAVIYNVYYVCYRYHLTSLWLVHFIGIFLMVVIVYFHIISWEKKPIIQSCLNPNSLLIPIYIFFFLQNGWGNNIQVWIKLHKDSYGSATSFITCCTGTVWQKVWSRLFAENIDEWTGSSYRA
jgi:hypothetical protein